MRYWISFFILFQMTGQASAQTAAVCQQPAALGSDLGIIANTILNIDDAITAVTRNTSTCLIVEGTCIRNKTRWDKKKKAYVQVWVKDKRGKLVKATENFCNTARRNLKSLCDKDKGLSIADNIKSDENKTGSAGLCYRGIKEILERLYGLPREKFPGTAASKADADFKKLSAYFKKVKFSDPEAKKAGTICTFTKGRNGHGHIEMLGSDGNYYSDFNQGKNSIMDLAISTVYKKSSCYVPTQKAKDILLARIETNQLNEVDLRMPAATVPTYDTFTTPEEMYGYEYGRYF